MTDFDEVCSQLYDELAAHVHAFAALVPIVGDVVTGDAIEQSAGLLAGQLLGPDERMAAQTVIDLANVLGWDTDDPHWWRTPLGQAVAASVGHPSAEAVTQEVAAAMLGVTRQRVQQLIAAGRLSRGRAGHRSRVSMVSVRRELAERAGS